MPLVVAVTICMLIIILGVAEYMRLVITAAGIKDAMESAVISTVNDNYNEVYHSVREGYEMCIRDRINDGAITREHAEFLRNKYLFGGKHDRND